MVTPGAAVGRHLNRRVTRARRLPDLSDGHGLLHVAVEGVAGLPGEGVEDSDCAIAMTGSNIFVIGVETDAEGLL